MYIHVIHQPNMYEIVYVFSSKAIKSQSRSSLLRPLLWLVLHRDKIKGDNGASSHDAAWPSAQSQNLQSYLPACYLRNWNTVIINSRYTSTTPWQHKNPNGNVFASFHRWPWVLALQLPQRWKKIWKSILSYHPIQGIYRVNYLSEGLEPDFSATSITDGFCARIGLQEKKLKRGHSLFG